MPEVMFNGPEGRLEGRYNSGANGDGPGVIFLHPHSLYGGTMNNRVVYEVFQQFVARGSACLRFNFRGAGRSKGSFSKGEGELADAATALDWLQIQHNNSRENWVVGFSFGAWIAMQLLMRRPEISGFICISPPANLYDFNFLSPCPCPGLIIHGTEDSFVPEIHVSKLHERLRYQKAVEIDYAGIDGADHFYKSHMDDLIEAVNLYLDKRKIGQRPDKAMLKQLRQL